MFYNSSEFNFINYFQEKIEDIRKEYLNLDPMILNIHRSGTHEELLSTFLTSNGWMPGWQVGTNAPNYNWLTYGLSYHNRFPPEACEKFPIIMNMINQFTGIKVCAFSSMLPFSFIAPHSHTELGGDLLTFHLGIDVIPGRSYLCVNGVFNEEKNNKAIVFDGSIEHFAINMGPSRRVILYLEFDKNSI